MDIILIPGLWLTASSWDAVVPVIERAGHRTHALTLPGMESKDADRSAMCLRDHVQAVRGRLVATTVETVRFTRPDRIDFRLVRGPVPEVTETFHLKDQGSTMRLEYEGLLGTDLWALGTWWGAQVADRWHQVVQDTFTAVKTEAERRARRG